MRAMLARIVAGLKKAGKAIVLFTRMPGAGPLGRAAVVVAGVLVLAVILVGLWWANESFGVERFLRPPSPRLGRVWLPLLFLLMFASAWTGWRLWRTLTAEPEASLYPDLERAWLRALDDLGRAGIDPREAPLYLILGRPAGSIEGLMGASRLSFTVRTAADDPGAPIHIYASREGIFVASEGASLLGRYAALVAGADPARSDATPLAPGRPIATPRPLTAAGRSRTAGRADAATVVAEPETDPNTRRRPTPSPLLQQPREVERLTRRLRLLCLLIARDRAPYCPVNGILLAIPFLATRGSEVAAQGWSACHRDLATARDALGVTCPVYALVCDLERVEGFPDLVERIDKLRRDEPVGRDFPLVPELPPSQVPDMIRQSVRAFAHLGFPALIYHHFRHESAGQPVGKNEPLYQLLRAVQRGHDDLARILIRGIVDEGWSAPMLAGFYLVGTGSRESDRAFAAGVFRRALEFQNAVAWTPQTVARDRILRRRTLWGYIAIALWSAGLLAMLAGIFIVGRP
jgi:hypothetical protein